MAAHPSTRLSHHDARRFGLVVGTAFMVLGGIAWWRGRPVGALVLGGIGIALVVLGVAVPGALYPVFRAWMGLAMALSKVTTPILLAVLYFGVLTPIGIVRRVPPTIDIRRTRRRGRSAGTPRPSHGIR